MAEYYPLQFGALAGTDDGSGIAPSANRLYGPWEDEEELMDFLAEATEEANPAIPDGLVAGFYQDDRTVALKKWNKPALSTSGYWSDYSERRIVPIAGVVKTGASKQQSSPLLGNKDNIYYYETQGVLGLSTDEGATYYPIWKNYPEYGSNDLGSVYPREGWIYFTLDGQLFISTSMNIGGQGDGIFNFTEAQRNALNSGITSTLVSELQNLLEGLTEEDIEELHRLKDMNIQYSHDDDELTLTDSTPVTGGTTSYDLSGSSGVTYTYGIPTATLVYPSMVPSGGGVVGFTSLVVRQTKTGSDNSEELLEYTGEKVGNKVVLSRGGAQATGVQVTFDLTNTDSDMDVNINTATGDLTVGANTDEQTYETKVQVQIDGLNGSDSDWESSGWIEQAPSSRYTYSITPSAGLSLNGIGTDAITIIVTPASGLTITEVMPVWSVSVKSGNCVTVQSQQSIESNVLTITATVASTASGSAVIRVSLDGTVTDIPVTVRSVAVETLTYDASTLQFDQTTSTVSGKVNYTPLNATFNSVVIETDVKRDTSSASAVDSSDFVNGLTSATVGTVDRTNHTIAFSAVLENKAYASGSSVYYYLSAVRTARMAMVFDSTTRIVFRQDSSSNVVYFPAYTFDRTNVAHDVSSGVSINQHASNWDSDLGAIASYNTPDSSGISKFTTQKLSANKVIAIGFDGMNFGDEISVDLNQNLAGPDSCRFFIKVKDSSGNVLIRNTANAVGFSASSDITTTSVKPYANLPALGSDIMASCFYFKLQSGTSVHTIPSTATNMKVEICFTALNTGTTNGPIIYIKKASSGS